MTLKPCIQCGEPSPGTRCSPCRGYDSQHDKLSKRARRLQPWCSGCGATEDLQLDHGPQTWKRRAEGKPLRLQDYRGVYCGDCNRANGPARTEPQVLQQHSRHKGGGMTRPNALVGPASRAPRYTPRGVSG